MKYEKFINTTFYKNKGIGATRSKRRVEFTKTSTGEECMAMTKEFKELPIEYLGKPAIEFAKKNKLKIIDGYYSDQKTN